MAHTEASLLLTFGITTLKKYTISIPKMHLMNGGPQTPGRNQSVIIEVPFTAKYDSGIAATAQVTRLVA